MLGIVKAMATSLQNATKQPVVDAGAIMDSAIATVDPLAQKALDHAIQGVRQDAFSVATHWAQAVSNGDTDELSNIELLDLMLYGDDEDTELDQAYIDILTTAFADALATLGVQDELITDLMSDDLEVAESASGEVVDAVIANMPDDGDDMDNLHDEFVFGEDDGDGDEVMDSTNLYAGKKSVKKSNGVSATYVAKKVIRHGHLMIKNVRASGRVKRTALQKAATKKAGLKSRSANAIKIRIRSFNRGKKMGLHK